uniref:Thiol:disulfide interchange protein n=1 Tax=Porphyridium purpureum TaxID=35688 RepID=W0RZC9_PORPP|nr:thiol:disulfide interchange protein [Porphyridium purpureum]BAO23750.1 thiol:disulfide interchange protein [Porphyridium purpureum]
MPYDYNILFQFQYYLESLNSYYMSNFNYLTIFILIILGCLSGINPCIMSLLPIYNAYLNTEDKYKKKIFFFILGIYTGVMMIVSLSTTIYNYRSYNKYGSVIIGLIIIFLGSQQLRITNFNNKLVSIDNFFKDIQMYDTTRFSSYLLGIALGFMGASCSTPSIVTLSLWLQNSNKIYLGFFFISIYSLGYIIPIIVLNFIFDIFNSSIKKIFFNEWFNIVGGNALIAIGTYYFLFLFE